MRPLYLILLFYVFVGDLIAQNRAVLQGPAPAWVVPQAFDSNARPPAGQEAGFYCLLMDEQENTIKQESYVHVAYKILSAEGVQSMSDLSITFDPVYQTLKLHSLRILRNGESIDKAPTFINTMQREQSMDRYLYDGSITAIINLADVRVGDIIEYSFTRAGNNPIYEGHVNRKLYFTYGFAYEKLFQRLIVSPSTELELEYRNADVKANISSTQVGKEYVWSLNRKDAIIYDANVPDWYDPNEFVMLTDFSSWADVADWASKHFEISGKDQQALKERITEKISAKDQVEFALEAIRFVQDEVRYLGFEGGLNSHKPHSPVAVFDQRFGDCKDKSLLLCAILRTANIEAYPVLVNSVLRDKVATQVPSINAFDHCVAKVKIGNQVSFVDPTINSQGGSFGQISFPPYGKGLVIDESTKELESLFSHAESKIIESQIITFPNLEGEAYLQVSTTYTGGEADYIRREFSNSNAESIQKNYLTFYGNLYPDIELLNPIAHKDNRVKNEFLLEENYRIKNFWEPLESDPDILYKEVYPQTLYNYFNITKSSQRLAPHRLQHPLNYQHSINIKFPQEWNIEQDERYIDSDFYRYEYYVRPGDKEVTLETYYQTKQDHVPLDAFPQFVADHEEMLSKLSFQISFNKAIIGNAKGISWASIVIAFISLGFGLWMVLRLYYYYDPKPEVETFGQGEAIGGWLILVALGLIFSPFRIVFDLFDLPQVYDSQVWGNFIALKRFDLLGFMFFTHVYNIVFLCYSVLILVLFIRRRSSLPKLIIIFYAVNCVVITLDTVIGASFDPEAAKGSGYYNNMIRAIVGAAIWIPYFLKSERVKITFVERLGGDNDDDYTLATAASDEGVIGTPHDRS